MEKVAALIDKLQELKNEGAELSELSYYTQLLYAELMCAKSIKEKYSPAKKKISVIMPGNTPAVQVTASETVSVPKNSSFEKEIESEEVVVAQKEQFTEKEQRKEGKMEEVKAEPIVKEPVVKERFFNFPKQQRSNGEQREKELNELIAENKPSLNDKLKLQNVELGSKLSSAPVQDLHRAIGINDKFQFINELFGGDRNIYERSVKTINECRNLQEAQYWIERELKIKYGWQDNNPSVQQFYTLIKKRFS